MAFQTRTANQKRNERKCLQNLRQKPPQRGLCVFVSLCETHILLCGRATTDHGEETPRRPHTQSVSQSVQWVFIYIRNISATWLPKHPAVGILPDRENQRSDWAQHLYITCIIRPRHLTTQPVVLPWKYRYTSKHFNYSSCYYLWSRMNDVGL